MKKRDYQRDFARAHPAMYDPQGREKKANTMIAVLQDALANRLHAADCVNIGCSTGIIDSFVAPHVRSLVGVDIDDAAISHANSTYSGPNLRFRVGDAMALDFPDASIDVVICSQVYEHVPDPSRMMREIDRILRPGGVCYFAATNRLCLVEQHYFLPFLSMLPQGLADLYLRMAGRGTHYYEKHLTYWGLRRLTTAFQVSDYTERLVDEPARFHFEYLAGNGGWKKICLKLWLRFGYWAFPGYIWLLRSRSGPTAGTS